METPSDRSTSSLPPLPAMSWGITPSTNLDRSVTEAFHTAKNKRRMKRATPTAIKIFRKLAFKKEPFAEQQFHLNKFVQHFPNGKMLFYTYKDDLPSGVIDSTVYPKSLLMTMDDVDAQIKEAEEFQQKCRQEEVKAKKAKIQERRNVLKVLHMKEKQATAAHARFQGEIRKQLARNQLKADLTENKMVRAPTFLNSQSMMTSQRPAGLPTMSEPPMMPQAMMTGPVISAATSSAKMSVMVGCPPMIATSMVADTPVMAGRPMMMADQAGPSMMISEVNSATNMPGHPGRPTAVSQQHRLSVDGAQTFPFTLRDALKNAGLMVPTPPASQIEAQPAVPQFLPSIFAPQHFSAQKRIYDMPQQLPYGIMQSHPHTAGTSTVQAI